MKWRERGDGNQGNRVMIDGQREVENKTCKFLFPIHLILLFPFIAFDIMIPLACQLQSPTSLYFVCTTFWGIYPIVYRF
jgi:hypothetical protein